MSSSIRGMVWKFGDHISTDSIAPGFTLGGAWEEIRQHILHINPQFVQDVKPGDVIVAGRNWGCGSSREQAPANLKRLGIGCIVADSFARIFFRNAIAIGLPCVPCADISLAFEEGDELNVNLETASIENLTKNTWHQGEPYTPQMLHIIDSGGLIPLLKKRMARQS